MVKLEEASKNAGLADYVTVCHNYRRDTLKTLCAEEKLSLDEYLDDNYWKEIIGDPKPIVTICDQQQQVANVFSCDNYDDFDSQTDNSLTQSSAYFSKGFIYASLGIFSVLLVFILIWGLKKKRHSGKKNKQFP